MVGHYTTDSLAAASFANNIFNLVIIFSTGFSYGLTPVVGKMFGRGDFPGHRQDAQEQHCGQLGRCIAPDWHNDGPVPEPWTVSASQRSSCPLIKPYYIVLLVSLLPVLLFNAFKQFADGISDTMTPMWILLLGNVVNIFGNWCLIFGKLGFPELGLLGAGISHPVLQDIDSDCVCMHVLLLRKICRVQERIHAEQG